MSGSWEDKFRGWAKPPSDAEAKRCARAEEEIRAAIEASSKLRQRSIKVFTQGSYRNNTNVRLDSDVDVGVLCFDTFFHDYPEGTGDATFGVEPATYFYDQFKREVGEALVDHFGRNAVTPGNKAFDIKESNTQVEADVAPFFEHRRYDRAGKYLSGVELRPDNGVPFKVINWPEQHYENGVEKNNSTGRRYKSLVRILKGLCNDMQEDGIPEAAPITGFLIECLVWNVPNHHFGHATYTDDLRAALVHLYEGTKTDQACTEWGEVSELKYLFRGPQKWTRAQAHAFILAAWQYVGFS